MKNFFEESNVFLMKIMIPAFVAVGFKIAVQMKNEKNKVSWINVVLSLIIGVGGAYLSSDLILESFGMKYLSIIVALVAIISEKIGEFLIYKFNVDGFLTAFLDLILNSLTKKKE